MEAERGDLLLFLAGSKMPTLKAGGQLRMKLARDNGPARGQGTSVRLDRGLPAVPDGPGHRQAGRVPPSVREAGQGRHQRRARTSWHLMGLSYDLVLDGSEIGSGSIRNHDAGGAAQGVPAAGHERGADGEGVRLLPGGPGVRRSASRRHRLGMDRLCAILLGCETIRDVIAFPKNKKFQSLVDGSPDQVEQSKLAELQLLSLAEEDEKS